MHIDIIKDIDKISDEYIVIGVSSGPDSMALLHMVMNNTNKKIVCAHINHNVRNISDEEADFLKEYCLDNNVIFECMKIDQYSESNFEAEARKKRYKFYEEILHKYKSHTLLLAHHGDDLIETVLMKIIRGSNLEGYADIKKCSNQSGYKIIRPLLSLTKEDILLYNKENNIKYYNDNTNEDITYTRNRLRKNILPVLKKEDRDIHLKFLKYSETLQEYYNYIEDITKDKLNNVYKNNIIDINIFNKEHPFMKKNIIFYILSKIYNDQANIIKDIHIEEIIKLTTNNKPNLIINLPDEYIVRKEYNYIYIEKNKKISKDYKIPLKNINKINNIIIKKVNNIDTDNNNVCRLNSNNIKLPLYLRNRKKGDFISLLGTNGSKKIKDIFIDQKMPLEKRNKFPLLVDSEDNILWIPGLKKSKYCAKKNELYDIILYSYEESEELNEKEN